MMAHLPDIYAWQTENGTYGLHALSALYHENAKVTRSDWHLQHACLEDPLRRLHLQGQESRLQAYTKQSQWGAKRYLRSPQYLLPAPVSRCQYDLGTAIRQRRSTRCFQEQAITPGALATLLAWSYGVILEENGGPQQAPRRAVPSGGALYALELYVLTLHVVDLAPGVYHYEGYTHALEQLTPGSPYTALGQALLYEELAVDAAVAIVISGFFARSRSKYGELGYRLTLLEAGHVGQNLCLTATALGLGACPVAGFVEDQINDVLGLQGVDETALYLVIVGQGATHEGASDPHARRHD